MNSQDFLDKNKIAQSFSRSAEKYDEFAHLQQQLAKEMVDAIQPLKIHPKSILDIGTGTGEVAFLLHEIYKDAKITGCDLAPGMIKKAKQKNTTKKIDFEVGDAEDLPYPDKTFDLVVSSTTYQWVEDLERAFAEAKRVMKPGSYFVFTTFGPESLNELKKSYKLIVDEKAGYLHKYRSIEDIREILRSGGFDCQNIELKMVKTIYESFRKMQKTIKSIGAVNASIDLPKGLRNREKIENLIKYYETNYSTGKGVYATYEVIRIICRS